MKRRNATAALALALAAATAGAQSTGGPWRLQRFTVAGGATLRGGDVVLVATAGQADAAGPSVGGPYALAPGWHARAAVGDEVFADGFEP